MSGPGRTFQVHDDDTVIAAEGSAEVMARHVHRHGVGDPDEPGPESDATDEPDPPRRRRRHWWRSRWLLVIIPLLVLALPVPWMHVISDDPPGFAWRLDRRLQVQGDPVDPPGEWSWLTVGRPPLVIEVLRDELFPAEGTGAVDMRVESVAGRPSLNEPAAAAVGLRHAGVEMPLGLLVEVREPTLPGYPERGFIVEAHDIVLSDREGWNRASRMITDLRASRLDTDVTFRMADGRVFSAPGPELPYEHVTVIDVAPDDLEARIRITAPFEELADLLPVDWFRNNVSLGRSHGMMVALTTYAEAAGHDLAQGRHIAGTGGIRGDGMVTRIGGLPAKAAAARDAGADVLLFPASQEQQLEDFDPGSMALVPVDSLEQAISWLEQPLV